MGVAANILNIAAIGGFFTVFTVFIIGFRVVRGGIVAVFLGLFAQQFFAVADRNLIIIGVNFVKGEKPVAVAAIFHKGRLQGRLNAGYFCQINIAAQGRLCAGFKIKFVDLIVVQNHHPGFFRVDGIDKHAFGHKNLRWHRGAPACESRGQRRYQKNGVGKQKAGRIAYPPPVPTRSKQRGLISLGKCRKQPKYFSLCYHVRCGFPPATLIISANRELGLRGAHLELYMCADVIAS